MKIELCDSNIKMSVIRRLECVGPSHEQTVGEIAVSKQPAKQLG